MKTKFKADYLLTILFLALIFGIGMLNAFSVLPDVKENLKENPDYFAAGGKNLEDDYRTSFWKRKNWINTFGISQKLLGRKIIGNVEFGVTESGGIEKVTGLKNIDSFAAELIELKNRLDQRHIPLLYVQIPPRQEKESQDPPEFFRTRTYYNQINERTADANIVRLDEEEILSGSGSPKRSNLYFKTDMHTTTEGELWVMKKICQKLNQEFGISIKDIDVGNTAAFQKYSYPFIGNLALSVGEYFVGTDTFEEYIPTTPTQLTIRDLYGTSEHSGKFDEVLMNGYSLQPDKNIYTYWITDYLKYGSSGYHIENQDSKGPSLLFICDSLCYRTIAYLSLGCSNITVLDPRFYSNNEGDLVEKVLTEKTYDAVVYLHGTFSTTDYSMFGRGMF